MLAQLTVKNVGVSLRHSVEIENRLTYLLVRGLASISGPISIRTQNIHITVN